MANRRVSELNALTTPDANDLFLVTDVSAVESKKIQASNLKTYALNGTASYANNSVSSSYAFFATSASWSPSVISASYALSASYADWAKTASYAISASWVLSASFASRSFWAETASFALTSSVQLVISSGLANYADTASFLLYTAGKSNGTASNAISASWATLGLSSSFLVYTGTPNGTASNARTASLANSASFLRYTSGFNGSASYALRSATTLLADSASTAATTYNAYIYRDFDFLTSSILTYNTASFGWLQISSSGTSPKVKMEAWGDVYIPITESMNRSGSLLLLIEGPSGIFTLDRATFQYWHTGSNSSNLRDTGSIICSFNLKGAFTVAGPDTQRYSASVIAYDGVQLYTGSRGVQLSVRATTDYFLDE